MPTFRVEASYKQRCEIQTLRKYNNWSYRRISEATGFSTYGCWKICQEPSTPKKRKGRPLLLNTPTRRRLIFAASQDSEHRQMPMIDVAAELGIEACERTIKKAFRKEGYNRRVARKKPFLTQEQKDRRLQWALEHRHWTPEQWLDWVLFTDECYIWMSRRGRIWVTRAAGEEYHPDCVVPAFSRTGSVMVWGGIKGGDKTELVVWERNDFGNINAETYVRHVLVPVMWPFIQEHSQRQGVPMGIMAVEDGAGAHRAVYTQEHRDHYGIQRLWWPACSPDLNPIENVWQLLKDILKRRNPRPRGTAEFKQAILEAWAEISPEELKQLVRSMPERIEAVIAAQGGHTRW